MTLDEYMLKYGYRDRDVAVALELTRSGISRIRRGQRMPIAENVQKIERWTNGQVTWRDLYAATHRSKRAAGKRAA